MEDVRRGKFDAEKGEEGAKDDVHNPNSPLNPRGLLSSLGYYRVVFAHHISTRLLRNCR
jgi:hypothetical protein